MSSKKNNTLFNTYALTDEELALAIKIYSHLELEQFEGDKEAFAFFIVKGNPNVEAVTDDDISKLIQEHLPTQESFEKQFETDNNIFSMKFLLIIIVVLAIIAALLYVVLGRSKTEKYNVVDMVQLTNYYQVKAKNEGLLSTTTDEQRAQILQRLQNEMSQIQPVLTKYAEECDCMIFVKSAIIAAPKGTTNDLTREIANRVNDAVKSMPIKPVQQQMPDPANLLDPNTATLVK